ncbi:MAG: ATP-dependent DNA helicase RecG [Clostridia bacterium]|nr:ATP-dependent DNA helicase RecG [Clostridia bacterium]
MFESDSVRYLKGVGERRAALLEKLKIYTVGDLINYYPRDYSDRSSPKMLSEVSDGEVCAVIATVTRRYNEKFIRKGMTVYSAVAADDKGILLKITIFNSIYTAKLLTEGARLLFYGKVTKKLDHCEMTSPVIENINQGKRIHPIYKLTEGLTSNYIERLVSSALNLLPETLYDPVPEWVRTEQNLCHIRFAIENIHKPADMHSLKLARDRLIFDELLYMSLGISMIKGRNKGENLCKIANSHNDEFWGLMPFTPTGAQKRASEEIITDMSKAHPMSRLVQGDVGSGKTAVAAAACYTAAKNGYQCAVMAPTEILARQHYSSFCKTLEKTGITPALLIGSMTAAQKRKVYEKLASGEIQVLIGTHALIAEKVEFKKLGLVITDEQHRVGVRQRAALFAKGTNPHILVMSATPIPRTLALIIYGDLDISVLDEMPPGRQKIDTYAVDSGKRARALGYLKKHIDMGRQGYIVCPLVEDGESELISAVSYFEDLSKSELAGYRVGLLHGKMKAAEKDKVMAGFAAGEIDILVATTVIEVGVDVPNAVIMIIENAERFGLSQLHQLRGRVGRGEHKSTCILISDAKNDTAVKRMEVMCRTNDGFEISNQDLALRGPGDFLGERQHGLPELKIADFAENMDVMRNAQHIAQTILGSDPKLEKKENLGLASEVKRLFADIAGGIS